MNEKQSFQKSIKYWKDGSSKDLAAAENLFEKGFYPQCLFFCHLSSEKMLKALFMKRTKKVAPFIHDLRRLAELMELDLTNQKKEVLDKIFTFNISTRYAEEKLEFYKKYNNKKIVAKYLNITKDLILWLKREFQKK
jgi:HEPN domain-containing protein